MLETATRGSYKYVAPSGTVYKSKSSALEARSVEGASAEAAGATDAPSPPAGKAASTAAGGKKGKAAKAAKAAKADGGALSKGEADVGAIAPKGESAVEKPVAPKMDKRAAKALKGKFIEVYWDGEAQWFEAEVLAFQDATGTHLVCGVPPA